MARSTRLRTNLRAIPPRPSLLGFTGVRPMVASKVAPLVLAMVYGPWIHSK